MPARGSMRVKVHGLTFVWFGGEYIDVKSGDLAIDTINVWDHDKNEATIPHTREALTTAAKEWVAENKDQLSDYIMSAGG